MNGKTESEILGEYASQGYWLKEYVDHVVTVNYKEKEIGAYPQTAVTTDPEALRACCRRHLARLAEPAEVTQ